MRALRLRNRPGVTALAVLMLSLGVGATTALFSLVDRVMPRSVPAVRCETVMRISDSAPTFAMEALSSRAELRDRVSDAYETSVESAGDAIDAIPDTTDALGVRPMLALVSVFALGFLLACMRGASGMIAERRAWLAVIGTATGALMVATLSLRALGFPAIGMRAVAFGLCISLVTVWFARLSQKRGAPLTN